MKRNGFTLVELLAVIAILAILVAIVMPNVMKEYNKAKANVFVTDTKSFINAAMSEFTTDAMNHAGKTIYYSSKPNSDLNTSKLSIDSDKEYFIEMDRHGNIKRLVIYDESYCYDIFTTHGDASIGILDGTKSMNNNGQPISKVDLNVNGVWDSGNDSVEIIVNKNGDVIESYFVKGCEAKKHSFDNDIVAESNALTLYGVLQKEAEEGTYAKKYTGDHKDSYTRSASHDIYHFHADDETEADVILNKNNVLFANHCWQMIRTTDTGGVKLLYNGEVDSNGKCGTDRGTHLGQNSVVSKNLASSYYYSTSYKYNSSTNEFSLDGDIQQAVWSNSTYSSLIGKYTCMKSTSNATCSTLYKVELFDSSSHAIVIEINTGVHYSSIAKLPFNVKTNQGDTVFFSGYMVGETYNNYYFNTLESVDFDLKSYYISSSSLVSVSSYLNGNSLYYPSTFSGSDWSSDYALYKNYYTCGYSALSCSSPLYILSTRSTGYAAIDTTSKILIAKNVNGNKLENTLSVRKFELFLDPNYYSDYKYTCNTTSDTCSYVYNIDSFYVNEYSGYTTAGFYYSKNRYLAKDVVYDNGKYHLVDYVEPSSINDSNQLKKYHYICMEENKLECDKVAYINTFYYSSDYFVLKYILLDNGEKIEDAVTNIFKKNVTDSTIKKYTDLWFEKNIYNNSSFDYLDEAIYCDDRRFIDDGSSRDYNSSVWNPNGNSFNDLFFKKNTDLNCSDVGDQFSINNNNAKLKYSIGLLNTGEISLLGNSKLININYDYWISGHSQFDTHGAVSYNNTVNSSGLSSSKNAGGNYGVRPVISLKAGTKYVSGDGSTDSPYVVE